MSDYKSAGLTVAIANILWAFLFWSLAMILVRMPDFWPPETIEIAGSLDRSHPPLPHIYRVGGTGSFRAWIHLKDDPLTYGIWDSVGYRWDYALDTLRDVNFVTLRVEAAAYQQARQYADQVEGQIAQTRDIDEWNRLVVGQLVDAKKDPVPVLEIRTGGETVFSKLSILHVHRGNVVFWAVMVVATIGTMAGLARYEKHRKSESYIG